MLGRIVSWCGPLSEELAGKLMWLPAAKKGRLLDVGCGNGTLMERARNWGWDPVGVEPDPVSSDIGRRRGFEVVTGMIEDAHFPDDAFDVVAMSHVVEHLPNPRKTLAECRRVLKKDGWLVMVTPNTGSVGRKRFEKNWIGLDVPRHLMIFNTRCMRTLLESVGFRVRELTTKARMGFLTWAVGNTLARTAVLPGLQLRIRFWRIPFGLAFHWREYSETRQRPAGEELFVIAEK
jgi:SAM-dependent methyltransferase